MHAAALKLAPRMLARATELQTAHPTVVYLSGRRDLRAQAHAMACNVVTHRDFIARTYVHAAVLQTLVDTHPDARSVEELETLFYDTMTLLPSVDLARISAHLTGLAVDLLPMEDGDGQMTPTGQAVYTWIHDCPDTKTFLVREAGLVRWHWELTPDITTTVTRSSV